MNLNEDNIEMHQYAVTVIHYVDAADATTAEEMVSDFMVDNDNLSYEIFQVDQLE